jgi:hypothetical protein
MSSVEIGSSDSDARESFGMAITAYNVGMRIGGATAQKQEFTVPWADQSHFALIKGEDIPVGNMAIIRKGSRVHAMLLIGYCFEDPAKLAEAMRAKVDASAGLTTK